MPYLNVITLLSDQLIWSVGARILVQIYRSDTCRGLNPRVGLREVRGVGRVVRTQKVVEEKGGLKIKC